MAVTPDGTRVYAANLNSNTVSVINTATNAVTASVAVGDGPVAFGQFIGPDLVTVATVAIDIKPGSFPNSINPKSKGVIPVAILTTASFDATTVDLNSVRFGRTGAEAAPVQSGLEDVDGDGDTDMILHFNTQETGIQCGDTSASLTGETFGGEQIEGTDSIQTVGCK
jgi:YVTN family beta-propeller protein